VNFTDNWRAVMGPFEGVKYCNTNRTLATLSVYGRKFRRRSNAMRNTKLNMGVAKLGPIGKSI